MRCLKKILFRNKETLNKTKNVKFNVNLTKSNNSAIKSRDIIELRNNGFFTSDILGSGNTSEIIHLK